MANIVPDAFKTELLCGSHNFEYGVSAQTYKLALYETTLGPPYTTASTVYSTDNEVASGGSAYPTGGKALVLGALSGSDVGSNTSIVDFDNLTFSTVTLTSLGAAIYNTSTTPANMLVLVIDFGGNKTATAGDFTIQFPAPTAGAAIIRLGD